jgi:hypothetical protein
MDFIQIKQSWAMGGVKLKNSTRISACMSKFNKKLKFVTNLNSEVVSRISMGIYGLISWMWVW